MTRPRKSAPTVARKVLIIRAFVKVRQDVDAKLLLAAKRPHRLERPEVRPEQDGAPLLPTQLLEVSAPLLVTLKRRVSPRTKNTRSRATTANVKMLRYAPQNPEGSPIRRR
jgi:hypothetical protein